MMLASALGAMLGTFVKTAGQANGLSIMPGTVMALLGFATLFFAVGIARFRYE